MANKRILILLPSFAGGGAERTVLNLIKYHNPQKISIKVCLLSRSGSYLSEVPQESLLSHKLATGLFERSSFKQIGFLLFRMIPFFKKEIRQFNPDVIMTVTESMNYLGYFFRLFGWTSHHKWVVRSGNNIFDEARSKGMLIGRILKYLLRRTYRKADHIITISQGIKEVIIERFDMVSSKISVIYNPIDYHLIQSLAYKNETSPFEYPYLLGIGRLAVQKRFDKMIRYFAESGLASEGYKLIIIGQGGQLGRLNKLSHELNISENVVFPGFQSNPYYFLKYASAFLLTSDWEGFAHVVAEALACDTPVISTDSPYGPGEILENGRHGFVVPRNDKTTIVRLLKEKAFSQVKFNGRLERAKQFDVKTIIPQYETLFLNV